MSCRKRQAKLFPSKGKSHENDRPNKGRLNTTIVKDWSLSHLGQPQSHPLIIHSKKIAACFFSLSVSLFVGGSSGRFRSYEKWGAGMIRIDFGFGFLRKKKVQRTTMASKVYFFLLGWEICSIYSRIKERSKRKRKRNPSKTFSMGSWFNPKKLKLIYRHCINYLISCEWCPNQFVYGMNNSRVHRELRGQRNGKSQDPVSRGHVDDGSYLVTQLCEIQTKAYRRK